MRTIKMNWYMPIECDNTVRNPLVCDYTNLKDFGFTDIDFLTGKEISHWSAKIIFQAKKKKNDGIPDDALQNHLLLPIYSGRFINKLQEEKIKGLQFCPIKILRPNNDEISDFSLVNIINYIGAFNSEKSDYTRFKEDFPNPNVRGKIAGVTKFVLYKKYLTGMDIIRLSDYKRSFFVSEKIKELFEKNNFTGYSFKQIELT